MKRALRNRGLANETAPTMTSGDKPSAIQANSKWTAAPDPSSAAPSINRRPVDEGPVAALGIQEKHVIRSPMRKATAGNAGRMKQLF